MHNVRMLALRLVHDERGATAIEYGLIAAMVAVGAVGGMSALGGGLGGSWSNTANKMTEAMK